MQQEKAGEKKINLTKMSKSLKPQTPWRGVLIYAALALIGMFIVFNFVAQTQITEETPLSQVISEIKQGNVKKIEVDGPKLIVTLEDGKTLLSRKEETEVFTETLRTANIDPSQVEITIKDRSVGQAWFTILTTFLPIVLIAAFFFFIFRQAREAGGQVFSFGQSRARLFTKDMPKVTFADVAGVDEAKKELEEVVEFLKQPQKFRALGARTPKGVLLVGPAGTGKTLLARGVAGEAGVPFFSVAGSEFMEMLVGVGSARVRDLFSNAKKTAPCLPGDARITLADGREVAIATMFKQKMLGVYVPSLVEDKCKVEDAKVIAITRRKSADLYKIRTYHTQIKATGNHLFPVLLDGKLHWKRADSLKVDNHIAAPRQIKTQRQPLSIFDFLPPDTRIYLTGENKNRARHLRSTKLKDWKDRQIEKIEKIAIGHGGWTDSILYKLPRKLNKDLFYLLGLINSDGNFHKTNRFNFSFINTEKTLHDLFAKIIKENFGYQARTYLNKKYYEHMLPKGSNPKFLKDCYTTHVNNRLIRLILEPCQNEILRLEESLIASWLRGIFDGNGCVITNPKNPRIVISAWEKELNSKIRSVLHRIGIVCYCGNKGNIEITGKENLVTFVEKVGSSHPEKANLLKKLRLAGQVSSRLDSIPIGSLLRESRKSLGMTLRQFRLSGKVSEYERNIHTPSRSSLKQILKEMEAWRQATGRKITDNLVFLKRLVNGEIFWSKVVGVEKLSRPAYVYDLTLNDHHNFVANGLFVHNCIIFIDEIESIGRMRGFGFSGGHDEREQTLNQILVEMDGFTPNESVIVLAASNRPDLLDPALTRPGRFDRRVVLDMPDIEGRKSIIKIHMKGKPFAPEVDIERLAKRTVGFSGADLANMLNEAAILAAREGKKAIDNKDLEEAATKVKLGPQKKRIQTEEDRKMTAFHEAGHAIVAHSLPKMDPIHRISIVSRGMTGGHTLIPPQVDRQTETKTHLLEMITTLLGGRAAEEMVFSEVTTGAGNDLEIATGIAREMVTEFGMSDLGPINIGPKLQFGFWPADMESRGYSQELAAKIDQEVRKIISQCFEQAQKILRENRQKLDLVAANLLEKETLEGEEFEKLVGPKKDRKEEKLAEEKKQEPVSPQTSV